MSKKNKKAGIIASAVIGAGLAIGAATTGAILSNRPVDVTYYANNGTPEITTQIKKGDNSSLPTPTREGYNFAGWYLDTGLTQQVTSTTKLKQNSKLYAGWELANYEVAAANAIDLQAETAGLKSIGQYAFANSKITSITIPDTVTSIGECAFVGCTQLQTVELGKSLEIIGDFAFEECQNLQSVNFGSGLKTINEGAFFRCNSLENVLLNDGLKTIGISAFEECTSLKSIVIPSTVTLIDDDAFSYCESLTHVETGSNKAQVGVDVFYKCPNIKSIVFNADITKYRNCKFPTSGVETVTFNYDYPKISNDSNSLMSGVPEFIKTVQNIIFGDNVITIGCFGGSNINMGELNVTIGQNVQTIGDSAFGYRNIKSIVIPSSVKTIGNYAFYGCGLQSLTLNEGLVTIGDSAFGYMNNLSGNLAIPNSVETIGESAFTNNVGLTGLALGSGVTTIGSSAFRGCTNLLNINVSTSNANYSSQDSILYDKNQSTLVLCPPGRSGSFIIPGYISRIGAAAFSGCTGLTSITITDNVTSIDANAFLGCINLTNIYIPKSVETIEASVASESPFRECSASLKIYCGKEEKPEEWNAYWNYYNNVSHLDQRTRWDITFNKYLSVLSFIFDGSTVTGYSGSNTDIIIPNGTTAIGAGAFQNYTNLTSITIPSGVTSIGANAFSGCSSLTTIIIPSGVTSIGAGAFTDCANLTCVYIPSSVTTIEASVSLQFVGCSDELNIYCGASRKATGWGAYWNNYDSDNKVNTIWSKSLSDCLSELYPDFTFDDSTITGYLGTNSNVIIPNGITSIGENAFRDNTKITNVMIANSVAMIEDEAFSGCTALSSIVIPNNVETIGDYAFADCTNLEVITIGESATYIGDEAFYNCVNLKTLYFNAIECKPFFEAKNVFSNCGTASGGFEAIFGENVKYIPRCCFYAYSNPISARPLPVVIKIDLSHATSLQSIGDAAFAGYVGTEELPWGIDIPLPRS